MLQIAEADTLWISKIRPQRFAILPLHLDLEITGVDRFGRAWVRPRAWTERMITADPKAAFSFEHRICLVRRLNHLQSMRMANCLDQLAPKICDAFIRTE